MFALFCLYLQFPFLVLVVDDEETNVITAGAIVTVTVSLSRKSFSSLLNVGGESTITSVLLNEPKIKEEEVKEEKEEEEVSLFHLLWAF